jgi:hypothetical protein
VKDPKASKKVFPENLVVQRYNFKAKHKPFIVFEPGNRMHYLKDRQLGPRRLHVPGACNHWPVGQALCDGRTVQAADRPTHFLGFPISTPPVHEKDGRSGWNGLYGMTQLNMEELVALARSWSQAPELAVQGTAFESHGYDRGERAYKLTPRADAVAGAIEFTIEASEESPLYHPAFVIDNWGDAGASVTVDGARLAQGTDCRIGHRHRIDGSTLIVWLKLRSARPVRIRIARD